MTDAKHEGRKITLISHSMGTTASFIGISKVPEFFYEHVNLLVALAPIAKINTMEPTAQLLGRFIMDHESAVRGLFKMFGVYEFLPYCSLCVFGWKRLDLVVLLQRLIPPLGLAALHLVVSDFTRNMDTTLLAQMFGHFPSGTSFNTGLHYL